MKKLFFLTTVVVCLTCMSGFTVHHPSKKNAAKNVRLEDPGPAWIGCDAGYLHSCYIEHYYVRDGEPGDTYSWYWEKNQPGRPLVYLNDGPSTDIELSEGDVLHLIVNSLYYGTYDYYDTAAGCEE